MSNQQVRIWVDTEFKRKLKTKAAENGKSILELTKDLANDNEKFLKKLEKKRGRSFEFNL